MKLYQAKKIKVKGITLLSKEDVMDLTEKTFTGGGPIPKSILELHDGSSEYWLSTAGTRNYNYVMTVDSDTGKIFVPGSFVEASCAVRPVLIVSNLMSRYSIGDTVKFGNSDLTYTVISENKVLANFSLGQMPFRREGAFQFANDFEKSDIKKWLDNWAKYHLIIPDSELSLER